MTSDRLRQVRRVVGAAGLAALAMWLLLCGLMWALQDRIVYPGAGRPGPAAAQGWELVAMPTWKGGLVGYHHAGDDKRTVLFLHGNGTDYEGGRAATQVYADAGWSVLVPEYPGYGGTPGRPSQDGLDLAATAAMDWLIEHGIPPSDVVVIGNSIGSGPAIRAARHGGAGLVIISGVADMGDMAHDKAPWVPGLLLRDHYRNVLDMPQVRIPVLVVHARDDEVVPFGHGVRLARAARTRLVALDHGGHAIAYEGDVQRMVLKKMDDWLRWSVDKPEGGPGPTDAKHLAHRPKQ